MYFLPKIMLGTVMPIPVRIITIPKIRVWSKAKRKQPIAPKNYETFEGGVLPLVFCVKKW